MEGSEFIVRLRLRGEKSEKAIKAAYKEQFNNLNNYAKDAKEAKDFISEYFQKNLEELGTDLAMHLWDLYAKNYKLQDYRECRAILKQIMDFAQMSPVKQQEAKTDPLLKLMKVS